MLLSVILLPVFTVSADSFEVNEIEQFENWANEHGITIVGVNKNSNDLYYTGYNESTDSENWKEISGVLIAADILYTVPENVLQVMDGKTIYFSTEYGRSYTVLDSFPDHDILVGLNRELILEQNINPHTVIHELGHIVDYHGIQGIYNDEQNIFDNFLDDRNLIFNGMDNYSSDSVVSFGYVSSYSAVNDAENFAENFVHYVIYSNEFRDKIVTDPLLIEEYEFMRDVIFSGFEF